MRNSILLRGVMLLLAFASPIVLRAQFQQPTDEELKMTSDPKAPGADAVYLEIRESTDDVKSTITTYVRVKVLTEKGKDLARVEIPYLTSKDEYWNKDEIKDVKGRTIHPDGTIVPLNVKPEDLMVARAGEKQVDRIVFTLPSVEVGSILEYSYVFRYPLNQAAPPRWEVQRKYFVHKAHYDFLPAELGWDSHTRLRNQIVIFRQLPPGVSVSDKFAGKTFGAFGYSLDVNDIAPVPDEEWMPPIDSLLYRVNFSYAPTADPVEFWKQEVQFWAKDVDKFTERSKKIQDAVEGLIAPSDTDLVKAKKLYDAVQALDNTDFLREKSTSERKKLKIKEAKHGQDTWAEKSGSSEDIAMLYLDLLREAGLGSYAIRVVDRERNIFDPGNIDLDQFDATLVYVSLGDKLILLDPGEKMCPFGTVSWHHSGAGGMGQSSQGVSLFATPEQDYKDNVTSRTGDIFLDAQGGMTGTLNIVMTGQAALYWRQTALQNDDSEVKKQFDEKLAKTVPDGVEAHIDHFLGMSDPYANLMAVVNVKGSLGTATGKRLFVPRFFFGTGGDVDPELQTRQVPFVNEEKRIEPVDMRYGDRADDKITLHLPDGMTVEGAPQDDKISWPGKAVFAVKTASSAGQIVVTDTLARAFSTLKPEEYQDLRGFYQKLAAAGQQQIVLTRAPAAAKGN